MKKFILTLVAVVAVCGAMAQPPRPMMPPPQHFQGGDAPETKKTVAERYAYLKEALDMSDEQLNKFAPVYQAYQRDIRGIRKELKTFMDSFKDATVDEKTAFRIAMQQLRTESDIVECKKEHLRVFKNYLTPEQISKIFLVEAPSRPHDGKRGEGRPREEGRPSGQRQE